jgi:heat shock protein HslJ
MKEIVLIITVSISISACNQSEEKEIGTYDSATIATNKTDTTKTTITNTSIPQPDTSTQKTVTAVPAESLQNFWVLESMDGKPLNQNDFPNGMPYFELNLKKNRVSGHAGCNSMNGSIKVEGNNILFDKIITPKTTCSIQDFENRYLNGLSGKKVSYTIEGGKLNLTAATNRSFIYRKIQQ